MPYSVEQRITMGGFSQEVLDDRTCGGRKNPWREKKLANEYLSMAYEGVDPLKAERLRLCSTFLKFRDIDASRKRLVGMNSCRVRLCPLCAWRRSLKTFYNMIRIMDDLDGKYEYIFLTLTVRNCEGAELSNTLSNLFEAWHRLFMRAAVKRAVKGYYRALEVTHNVDRTSAWYDTYHPHFHAVLAVDKRYYKGKDYIRQDMWKTMWMESMWMDYEPQVDVRRVRGITALAVAEVAKYAVKDCEYIFPDDWELSEATVRVLDEALNNRRLIAYGGVMREAHRRLNLEDDENGDLVNVDGLNVAEDGKETVYVWHSGYAQYIRED